ncbi:MAG: Ppx/GppA family phosphatase [Myxococcales bacterium]|nr:Ppx/GppA family phosphatase [Myxococcales bacterium]
MSEPIKLAAIDAGSNAIRILIVEASTEKRTCLAAERVSVRLGQGTFATGALADDMIDRAVQAFVRFRALFDEHEVSVYRAVATSAVRCATNRERLIDRIFQDANIDLEVIDGAEEGRLVRKAVLAQFGTRKHPDAIFDLGGGSLEVMRRSNGAWLSGSTRIGTVRLLETFGLKGIISDDERKMVQRFLKSTLRSGFVEELRAEGIRRASCCGGNAECLVKLFGQQERSGMGYISLDDLRKAATEIAELDVKQRMAAYKVRKDRAEVMGVASIVLSVVGKELGLEGFTAPGVGIRDGVVLDLAEAQVGKLRSATGAPSIASARSFAARLGHNVNHGEQVRVISNQLFEELTDVHKLPQPCATVLQLAALLHDVGEVVHRRSHHKHSEYLILHGRIPGLESPQRELVAATARGHRKSLPGRRKHKVFANLDAKQQGHVLKMSALLRLADTLDSSPGQQVVGLAIETSADEIVLVIFSTGNVEVPAEAIETRQLDFMEVFGRRLVFRYQGVAASASKP